MKTLAEAAKKAGISYRRAARWVEDGLIQPPGYQGRQRVQIPWSDKLTRELCLLARLRKELSLQELKGAAEYLRSKGYNPFSKGQFFVFQGTYGKRRLIRVCKDKSAALSLIGREQGQLLLFPIIIEGPSDGM